MFRRLSAILTAVGIGAFAAAAAHSQQDLPKPGILGEDDRRIVDSATAPWQAVGHVNVTEYDRRRQCTGTLVAPNLVVTAAHCLRKYGGQTHGLGNIHFVAGVRRNKYQGHSTAACVKYVTLSKAASRKRWARYLSDVAVIVLRSPIDIEAVRLAENTSPDVGAGLAHAGYPRDRRFLPSLDDTCRLERKIGDVWLTSCDTNYGSSGGPVFVRADGDLRLGAVMVAALPFEASVAIALPAWRSLIENTSCKAR